MTDFEANKATIHRFWAAVGNRDVEGYLSTFAPGAIARDPVNQPPLETTEQRRAYLEGVFAAVSDIAVSIDFLTTCGDHSPAQWSLNGKGADGSAIAMEGIDVARHDADGRIAELWGYL